MQEVAVIRPEIRILRWTVEFKLLFLILNIEMDSIEKYAKERADLFHGKKSYWLNDEFL